MFSSWIVPKIQVGSFEWVGWPTSANLRLEYAAVEGGEAVVEPTLRIYNMHNVVGTVTVPTTVLFAIILRQTQDRL